MAIRQHRTIQLQREMTSLEGLSICTPVVMSRSEPVIATSQVRTSNRIRALLSSGRGDAILSLGRIVASSDSSELDTLVDREFGPPSDQGLNGNLYSHQTLSISLRVSELLSDINRRQEMRGVFCRRRCDKEVVKNSEMIEDYLLQGLGSQDSNKRMPGEPAKPNVFNKNNLQWPQEVHEERRERKDELSDILVLLIMKVLG